MWYTQVRLPNLHSLYAARRDYCVFVAKIRYPHYIVSISVLPAYLVHYTSDAQVYKSIWLTHTYATPRTIIRAVSHMCKQQEERCRKTCTLIEIIFNYNS